MTSKMNGLDRRNFIKAGGLLGLTGAIALPSLARDPRTQKMNNAPDELTILFQGDSITDAGRDRAHYYPNDTAGMGRGYVFQIVTQLLGAHPDRSWEYYNRGISGNKVYQLADRWEDDCLQLKPDVLSILIGVNDFWHTLNNYDGTVEVYEADFRRLLDRTLDQYPDLKLVIGEPFAVKGGRAIDDRWFPEFPKYQEAARKIANDYKTAFIPYQQIFDEALELAPVDYWCPDGVHPSMAGGYLMKEAWIKTFEELY
jgi:lysophospholipase L1-like esterase